MNMKDERERGGNKHHTLSLINVRDRSTVYLIQNQDVDVVFQISDMYRKNLLLAESLWVELQNNAKPRQRK